MTNKSHWEHIYETKDATDVSWFQPHALLSVRLIKATGLDPTARIIDVGGGASTLVDDLLSNGYSEVTVLDISGAALQRSRDRLGQRAKQREVFPWEISPEAGWQKRCAKCAATDLK
jgi:ubiquinone/menaquinone biosynthesis C-methylase UbiE